MSDTLLLIGFRDTLEAAIDRSLLTAERQSSPLLPRGARLAATYDLWISATALPDPLVSVFIPVALESGDFDGGVSVRHGLMQGLMLEARYDMATPQDAELSAEDRQKKTAAIRADTDTKIKPILTAEQWKKLEQLREERKAQGNSKKKK